MAPLSRFEDALWYVNSLAYVIVAIRLLGTNLYRSYPAFLVYVVFRAIRSTGLRWFHPSENAYAWAWMVTEPIVWILFGYIVFEQSSIALRSYRGLATVGRKGLLAALALSLLAALATLYVDVSHSKGDFPVLLAFNLARRAVWATLSLYLLLLACFLLWFPIPISRNLLLHTVLLTFYSAGETALLFVRNLLGPGVIPQVSTALLAITTAIVAGWLGLTRAGEIRPALARPRWHPETEHRLLEQLAALNSTLTDSAGRNPRQ